MELVNIPNCPSCGRKTHIYQKSKTLQTGKQEGWTKFKHRCEIHGNFEGMVRKERKGES
ncbi:unnamed protein product [marine sediment metagenome]|uniref:Uncharacterized protein n=1 Tax=marine sediment metagenome TaxID=412755 RepID=X0Z2E0_9ZZZZ